MTKCKQKLSWIILLLLCNYTNSSKDAIPETKEDLTEAEAKDGQLEIIKTIKKINDDGSYTIGYEADDGSFKIESRDVLGNVKGTYGYVDEDGDIKRVAYSTSNITDLLAEAPTVVQRIPKTNKTSSSTRKSGVLLYNPTTQSPSTSTSVIQAIPRRRTTMQTTTTTSSTTTTPKTEKSNYGSTTNRPTNVIYATSVPPRSIIYTQRPLLRSTIISQAEHQKSEGQIIRPETATGRPTELPAFRRLALKNPLLENDSPTIKPVTEEPEIRGNLLRRQLSQEKTPHFDPRQHVITLQQGLGDDDAVDVYSASLTTGTPRPLFTTTFRPRILPSAQVGLEKPFPRYLSTQSSALRPQTTTEIDQQSTTTETTVTEASTPVPVPQYHIPAGNPENPQQQLVAVRHPFHGGVVLVPYNQLRLRENHQAPVEPRYYAPNGPYFREIRPTPTATAEQQQQTPAPVFIQRPPVLRSIPVEVDEHGYVRPPVPQIITPTPYSVPIPITPPPPKPPVDEEENEVDSIKPPVSTKDFQKLLELLITRQARLEQANAIINAQRQRELFYLQRLRNLPNPTPLPILVRHTPNGPVTFLPEAQIPRSRPFVDLSQMQLAQPEPQQQHTYVVRPQIQQEQQRQVYLQESPITYTPAPTSYTPTKRVARLLHNPPKEQHNIDENFLPPQIREMLLLRMLQLAINPSLPLENDNEEQDSMPSEQHIKKTGVRNVEIIGEEDEEQKIPSRSKRYRGNNFKEYYER